MFSSMANVNLILNKLKKSKESKTSKKLLLILFNCIILLNISCSKDKNKKEALEFFTRANYHSKKNEPEKAIPFYNECIEKLPEFADAYNNRGLTYEKMGDIENAKLDYERAIQKDKDFFQAKFNLARISLLLNNLDKSTALVEEIKNSSYKDSSQYYSLLGDIFVRRNNVGQAITNYEQAIKLKPKNDEALSNYGFAYFQIKEYAKAIEQLEKALAVNPQSTFALNNLGLIYSVKEDYTKAKKYLTTANDLDKVNPIFQNNLGYVLLQTGDLETGKELIEKALAKDGSNAWANRNLGVYYLKSNNTSKALESFKKAEQLDPSVDKIYYYLGLATKASNKTEACKYFSIGAKLNDLKCVEELKSCK